MGILATETAWGMALRGRGSLAGPHMLGGQMLTTQALIILDANWTSYPSPPPRLQRGMMMPASTASATVEPQPGVQSLMSPWTTANQPARSLETLRCLGMAALGKTMACAEQNMNQTWSSLAQAGPMAENLTGQTLDSTHASPTGAVTLSEMSPTGERPAGTLLPPMTHVTHMTPGLMPGMAPGQPPRTYPMGPGGCSSQRAIMMAVSALKVTEQWLKLWEDLLETCHQESIPVAQLRSSRGSRHQRLLHHMTTLCPLLTAIHMPPKLSMTASNHQFTAIQACLRVSMTVWNHQPSLKQPLP